MKKFNAKKLFCVLLSLMLIVVIAFTMQACTDETSNDETTSPVETTENSNEKVIVGEGETVFEFNVTHKDGSVKQYAVSTDKATVGEALVELEIISGDESDYGLYVKTVDGETLDYDTDKMYWAFYEGETYAQKGVDQTEITNGVTYAFKAEK